MSENRFDHDANDILLYLYTFTYYMYSRAIFWPASYLAEFNVPLLYSRFSLTLLFRSPEIFFKSFHPVRLWFYDNFTHAPAILYVYAQRTRPFSYFYTINPCLLCV